MISYDNSEFYHSQAWKRVSVAYMTSKSYICERCGRPAVICHHRNYLTDQNVTDPTVALNFDNLEALCQDCHNKEHFSSLKTRFDSDGNMIGVKQSRKERQFEIEKKKIDAMLDSDMLRSSRNRAESILEANTDKLSHETKNR